MKVKNIKYSFVIAATELKNHITKSHFALNSVDNNYSDYKQIVQVILCTGVLQNNLCRLICSIL